MADYGISEDQQIDEMVKKQQEKDKDKKKSSELFGALTGGGATPPIV